MVLKQALSILILAIILGLGVNLISPNSVAYIGNFRDISSGDGPIVPPTAMEGDPAFIDINVAQMEHATGGTIFVDARDELEYECGTIPGSINIPFEYMPEDNLVGYLDSALGFCPKDSPIIVFCSGEECDLSLHLARNLQEFGYTRLAIFFGGSREWEKFGFDLEVLPGCEN
ncbi:rhodanese-like domain-containing protein [bacterium]|nr:rhodanese-like domain-containing protein [bacterium]MCB2201660.1 rhodanese-like domain-containing protein [bacterium]